MGWKPSWRVEGFCFLSSEKISPVTTRILTQPTVKHIFIRFILNAPTCSLGWGHQAKFATSS